MRTYNKWSTRIPRTNDDRSPNQRVPSRGVQVHVPLGNVLDFFIPQVPSWGFLSNSEKFDVFPKVETGMDLHLIRLLLRSNEKCLQRKM